MLVNLIKKKKKIDKNGIIYHRKAKLVDDYDINGI